MQFPEGKYMWLVNVNEKGQLVIPKEAREVFHIEPGSQVLLLGDIERGLAIARNADMQKFAASVLTLNEKKEENEER